MKRIVFQYGGMFGLETLEDGAWVSLEGSAMPFFTVAYDIPSGVSTQPIHWTEGYGALGPGRYRIVKYVTRNELLSAGSQELRLYAEFELPPR